MAISITNTGTGDDSDACSSPRLSFSCDLPERNTTIRSEEDAEAAEVTRLDKSLLSLDDSSPDFNFYASTHHDFTAAVADELFFNGMIIPTQMKQKLMMNSISGQSNSNFKDEEEITGLTRATLIREDKNLSNSSSSSIWRFNRSGSLNNKRSSIWSLPLLFRSKSTGFSSSSSNKPQTQKKSSKFLVNNNSSASHQKPPLKKTTATIAAAAANYYNVPSPYIAKGTSDLFGFSSLFRNGSVMDKKTKK